MIVLWLEDDVIVRYAIELDLMESEHSEQITIKFVKCESEAEECLRKVKLDELSCVVLDHQLTDGVLPQEFGVEVYSNLIQKHEALAKLPLYFYCGSQREEVSQCIASDNEIVGEKFGLEGNWFRKNPNHTNLLSLFKAIVSDDD
jgi:hypothetical protein